MESSRFLIGSKLLQLDNCHDIDYLEIVDSEEDIYKRKYENGQDILYRSKKNIEKSLNFVVNELETPLILIFNYQMDKNIIGSDFPFKIGVLERKSEYVKLLCNIVENKLCNFNKKITCNGCCSKIIYHIAYNIFILENNTYILNSEQKEIIQKIHDLKMPIEYLDVLEKKVYKLREDIEVEKDN